MQDEQIYFCKKCGSDLREVGINEHKLTTKHYSISLVFDRLSSKWEDADSDGYEDSKITHYTCNECENNISEDVVKK